jgi:hypothetical protein
LEHKTAPVTLAEFVREKQALLTVTGVMTGLTVYSSTFGPWALRLLLSGLFLGCVLVLAVELLSHFPPVATVRLVAFQMFLTLAFCLLAGGWMFLWIRIGPKPLYFLVYFASAVIFIRVKAVTWLDSHIAKHRRLSRLLPSRPRKEIISAVLIGVAAYLSWSIVEVGVRHMPTLEPLFRGMVDSIGAFTPPK